MNRMRRLCVFCGSSAGSNDAYLRAALDLAESLTRNGIDLVYGGARVGLMGAVADGVLAHGGTVIGVIPRGVLEREVAHDGLTELHVVGSMHERKAMMAELADGFVALPGGMGTLEELCEVLTWGQLGLHAKPCGLLNVAGYFDPLLQFFDRMVDQQFLRPENRSVVLCAETPADLLERFAAYHPPRVPKWIGRGET